MADLNGKRINALTMVAKVAERIQLMHLIIQDHRKALMKIREGGIHHPQCVVDNCRTTCPIRIAQGELDRANQAVARSLERN